MIKDKSSICFRLTDDMFLELIKFSEIKKKINLLDSNDRNDEQIKKLEEQLENCKKSFISEFKKNNKKEIEEYLKLNEQ